ncbi:MAG: MFS transporter [Bacteroidales bacterium]|nr:MFS transporter [Bacteroidales bacterium]MCP5515589.1 MFS transporter [Spirochaetales bacterium]
MPVKKPYFGFGRNIFFTGLTSFLTDTSSKMVYSVMPMFLLSLGASKTTLSLIEGIAESTAALVKTLAGFRSDKTGKNKPLMLIGYMLTAIVTPFYAWVLHPSQVLYLRFIERFGKGMRTAPRDSLIAGSAVDGRMGRSFGFHKAMDNAGAIAGPLIAYLLLRAFPSDFHIIFLISAVPAILGVLTIILFIKEARKPQESLYKKFSLRDFPTRYYVLLAIIFLFTLGNSTDALLIVKANEVGVKLAYIPLVYLVFNAVSVIFSIPMGALSDKLGRERLLVFGYFIYAIVYFGFGYTSHVQWIIALFALYGIYSSSTDSVQKAMVSDYLDKNKRGTGLGIYNAMLGITLLPASIIAGLLYDKVNSSVPFYFGACTAVLSGILMIVFYHSNKRNPEKIRK